MNLHVEHCPCDDCFVTRACALSTDIDKRLDEGADILERLVIAPTTPRHVAEQLVLCARTVRRGKKLPTLNHKIDALADFDFLLESITVSIVMHTARTASMN